MTMEPASSRRVPEQAGVVLGVATGVVGLADVVYAAPDSIAALASRLVVVALMAGAASLFRDYPGLALSLAWAGALVQSTELAGLALVEVAAIAVSYGTARYGDRVTVWAGILSVPLAAGIAAQPAYDQARQVAINSPYRLQILRTISWPGISATVIILLGLTGLLSVPWLTGLLLRLRDRVQVSEREQQRAQTTATRAEEQADLRAEQARLAADVHDIVGHSLAVIVAQADSVQYLGDEEIARVRQAISNIADSARQSLGDVRGVLASLDDQRGSEAPLPDLDSLVDGVREAGRTVSSEVIGAERALDRERSATAYRVLQEALTNALRHGRSDTEIQVERRWTARGVLIRVSNLVAPGTTPARDGHGLRGMRTRIDAVHGTLAVQSAEGTSDNAFILSAFVPVPDPDRREPA